MPRHLTATELVLNGCLFGGVGGWLGGGRGAACGIGLLAILYGFAILRALPPPEEPPPGDAP